MWGQGPGRRFEHNASPGPATLGGVTFPAQFVSGGPELPRSVLGEGAHVAHLQFLTAEERATATLMGFYEQARLDLETFIREGSLSGSDATYYRQLLDETNRIASKANAQGATWVSSTIPEAYSAGWRQNSSVVVPQRALEALSRDTLGLITQTSEGMRDVVRQSIAAGILQGLPAEAVQARILASGLSNIPHWPSVEYRAGVIARTETMRAYNAGIEDVSLSLGAKFCEWIASPDEAVCALCAPLDGMILRLVQWEGPGPDPYPAAIMRPKLPRHPRCRCTMRSVYRGPDGKVLRADAPDVEPSLPPDAMGGRDLAVLPPSVGDPPTHPRQFTSFEDGKAWADEHMPDLAKKRTADIAAGRVGITSLDDVKGYTAGGSGYVNPYLRSESAFRAEYAGDVAAADRAVDRAKRTLKAMDSAMSPVPETIEVHRGTDYAAFGDLLPQSTSEIIAERYALAQGGMPSLPGKIVQEPGFLSTNVGADILDKFGPAGYDYPLHLHITVPKGTKAAWVQPVSTYPDEYEMVLDKGLRYVIDRVEFRSGPPSGGGDPYGTGGSFYDVYATVLPS